MDKTVFRKPIVTSLLQNDWYKYTIGQYYFENHANCVAMLEFTDRKDQLPGEKDFVAQLNWEFDRVAELKLTPGELEFIFKQRYMKSKTGYKEFLRNFQLNRDILHCELVDGRVKIWTDEANVMSASAWEIYILIIVNACYVNYMKEHGQTPDEDAAIEAKLIELDDIKMPFMEFGTRRRQSDEFQARIVAGLIERGNTKFLGTSNPYLAMKHNLTPLGSIAHECYMMSQTLTDVPVCQSQKHVFQTWIKTWDGDNGYALIDTLTFEKFVKDFGILEARQYTGVRIDSGDPFEITEKIIQIYKDFGIDPMTKTIIYSDCMDVATCNKLWDTFNGRIKMIAGIGTNLTGFLFKTNFVAKLVRANGKPTAKISFEPSKAQCKDPEFLKYLMWAIK